MGDDLNVGGLAVVGGRVRRDDGAGGVEIAVGEGSLRQQNTIVCILCYAFGDRPATGNADRIVLEIAHDVHDFVVGHGHFEIYLLHDNRLFDQKEWVGLIRESCLTHDEHKRKPGSECKTQYRVLHGFESSCSPGLSPQRWFLRLGFREVGSAGTSGRQRRLVCGTRTGLAKACRTRGRATVHVESVGQWPTEAELAPCGTLSRTPNRLTWDQESAWRSVPGATKASERR